MRKACLWLLLAFFVLTPLSASAAIAVYAEPGTDPQLVHNVQLVADAFDQILATELGVTLDKDVKLFVAPSRDAYIQVLQRELGLSQEVAERSGKMTSGFSASGRQTIALNGGLAAMKTLGGVSAVAAHELFHQVQKQLEGGKWVRLYWVSEGTADYVGAMVADRLGVMSLDGWKQQRINLLRKTPGHARPQELADINLAQWSTLMEQGKQPYTMSDLMVVFLLEQGKNRSIADFTEYFRQCRNLQNGRSALQAAFGMGLNEFLARFDPWFASLMTRQATVSLLPAGAPQPALLAEAGRSLAAVSSLLENQWGVPLQSNLRLVLAASAAEYSGALTREFGYAPDAAAKMSAESWRFNRNTAVLRLDGITSAELRSQRLTELVARMWVADTLAAKATQVLFWLRSGGILCAAAMATDRLYPGAARRQQSIWLQRLDATTPSLAELSSLDSYQALQKQHGARKLEALSALATQLLIEKHGLAAYGDWLRSAGASGNDSQAFATVFGISWAEFAEQFQSYLQQLRKQAA